MPKVKKKKVKISLRQAVEAYRAVRRPGSHIFHTVDSVINLTRRRAALYPQEDFWYSFLLEAESTPWS
jgi:hypothetical protein